MKLRIAFAGFRHIHIMSLYELVQRLEDIEITGAAEDHKETRSRMEGDGFRFSHDSVEALLDETSSYDALAIGDYYGRRGSIAIKALRAGKHIILDKPVCTSLQELKEIEILSSERSLSVGCQLDSRYSAQLRTLKRLIGEGIIGKVVTVNFMGQHPLIYGTRPMWYFEEGKHGGTINDIAIHAIDVLQWILGTRFSEVLSARVWNDTFKEHPDFNLCGQMMLKMEDGTGVLGDVSYLSPNSQGYTVPHYWRYTFHGQGGILETSHTTDSIGLWKDGDSKGKILPFDPERQEGYLYDFINELQGRKQGLDLTTAEVLESSRITLMVQKAADEGMTRVSLSE